MTAGYSDYSVLDHRPADRLSQMSETFPTKFCNAESKNKATTAYSITLSNTLTLPSHIQWGRYGKYWKWTVHLPRTT
jgi:hypothetical protein